MSSVSVNETPYEELLKDLEKDCLAGVSEEELKGVVKHFENIIESNRVCSHIKTLSGLIKILEARGVLKPSDVTALEKVSELLQRPTGVKRVQEYCNNQPILINAWSSPPLLGAANDETCLQIPVRNTITDKSKQSCTGFHCFLIVLRVKFFVLVFQVISEKIGANWRLFARALSIRESEIDQISRLNPKDSEKATKEV